jgi:hypothetical protein
MPFDSTENWPWAEQNLTGAQIDRFRRLLAWLDTGGDDKRLFDYHIWHCGTSACIGGWLEFDLFGNTDNSLHILFQACGIPRTLGDDLFYGGMVYQITTPIAAACVRGMLATGRVDWQSAIEQQAIN